MADVKFMDLSQNDNPAITDSVLIGNSTDGLKRTSIGEIVKLAPTNNLFHFETVTGHNDPTKPLAYDNSSIPIVPPDVAGYNFAFWLNSWTVDILIPSYVEYPSQKQTKVWIAFPPNQAVTATTIMATAVYVKSPTIG